jgi:hypothetical protein
MGTPPLIPRSSTLYPPLVLARHRIIECVVDVFSLKATVNETSELKRAEDEPGESASIPCMNFAARSWGEALLATGGKSTGSIRGGD